MSMSAWLEKGKLPRPKAERAKRAAEASAANESGSSNEPEQVKSDTRKRARSARPDAPLVLRSPAAISVVATDGCMTPVATDTPRISSRGTPMSVAPPGGLLWHPPIKGTKTYNDAVHGRIHLPGAVVALMDTPQFQRLRKLKQLGLCYHVYPDACHNRFEHSLGVAHLAAKQVQMLRSKLTDPAAAVSDRDALCVQLAGLCHDLGHGPFSHVFDGHVMPVIAPSDGWTHEEGSAMMLEHLIGSNGINLEAYGLQPEEDVAFIKELIEGVKPEHVKRRDEGNTWPRPRWLYFLVNNTESGLDVDKLDYYQRDCFFTGISMRSIYSNLMDSAEVTKCDDNQFRVCYPEKYVEDVYHAFRTRFDLHHKVYQHRVVRSLEYMVVDALIIAAKHLEFRGQRGTAVSMAQAVHDPEAYTRLNDSIIDLIWHCDNPELEPARQILLALERRELYRCVGSCPMTTGVEASARRARDSGQKYERQVEQEILGHAEDLLREGESEYAAAEPLLVDDIVVEFTSVHHGKKDLNPVDSVYFFRKSEPGTAPHKKPLARRIRSEDKIPATLPKAFMARSIRVFSKRQSHRGLVTAAFRKWTEDEDGCSSPLGSLSQPMDGDEAFYNSQLSQ